MSAHEKSIDLFTYNIGIMSYIDNEILERLIGTMVEGFARIEKKLDQMNRLKECMNGDKLLDNVDLAELLGVSQILLGGKERKIILSRLRDTEFPAPAR